MSKLHELLAVEGSLAATDKKLQKESIKTLGKESLFMGQVRKLTMFDSSNEHLNTTETQELTSTVDENFEYLIPFIADYWDAVGQKDATNQVAVADLIVNGTTVMEKVPSTFLLGLEQKLAGLRQVYEAIPTLAPGVKWIEDKQDKNGVFKTENSEISFKTEKDIKFREASPATKEHPAQMAQQVNVVNNIGKYDTTKKSGMFTPS